MLKPLLNPHSTALNNLLENAQLFQALLEVGQEQLPLLLRPHLLGVSFEGQNLILQIDDAIWATQLRFYEPTLLGIFQQHFPHLELTRIKVTVLPLAKKPQRKPKIMTYPTEQDALELQKTGEEVQFEGLRRALFRLSQRSKN